MSDEPKWTGDAVATLVEKGALLISTLIRRARMPDKVLREITNMTQQLKEGEDAIDARVDALYDEKTPTEPSEDNT